ncbi:ComF family protein [Arthrobacter celericrescens]|uniref:ComF family protein n=1 Tax=Arthrobacter celericrescens TaxID=2320851 RepID=UPI001FE08101|nr:phosphoribosyltransferase family protein [Arthrobacter celericrescens]
MDKPMPGRGAVAEAESVTYDAGVPGVRDPDLFAVPDHAARHRGAHARALSRLLEALGLAWAELIALVAPVECVCCGREDTEVCGACARRIRKLCANPFRAESQAPALLTVEGTVLVPVVAVGPYREELAQAVLSFKKFGQRGLALLLGRMLERGLSAAAGETSSVCLVPVPSSAAAFRRRGFSPVHLLLRQARRREGTEWVPCDVLRKRWSGLPAWAVSFQGIGDGVPLPDLLGAGSGLLGRARSARPGSTGQKGLDRGGRARRVRGSMAVRPSLKNPVAGKPCIIVDDVLTTGATIAEAARAVEAAGGLVRGAVVLAATRAPGGQSSGDGKAAHGQDDSKQIKSSEGVN